MVQVRKNFSGGDDYQYLDGEGAYLVYKSPQHYPLIQSGYCRVKALRYNAKKQFTYRVLI
jgi:hypothetical protein